MVRRTHTTTPGTRRPHQSCGAGATAVGVTAALETRDVATDERLGPLHAELERLDAALRALDRADALSLGSGTDAERFAQWFGTVAAREARGAKPETGRWSQALDALRAAELTRADRARDSAEARARLSRERDLAQRQRDRLATTDDEQIYVVDVAVDCGKSARTEVRLSYVVPGATWHPEYDLRFEAARGDVGPGTVKLGVGAVVQQATGEDWSGVTLVLSSARPWLGVEPPEPAPMRVGGSQGPKGKVLVQAQEERQRLDRDAETRDAGAAPQGAGLDDKGQSVTLTLPHRVDVRSDGRPYWAPVATVEGKGEARYVAVPKLSAQVYRMVSFRNPAAYPLLAGRLHTWRAGTFVGTQSLEHTGPGAPVEVSLGADATLRATREVLEDRTRDPGFLSSTRVLPRAYAITVRSSAKRSVTVEVRENIPVSKEDAVKVEVSRKTTTEGYALDALTGLVTWPVTVQPGGKATVALGYRIKLPDDWQL